MVFREVGQFVLFSAGQIGHQRVDGVLGVLLIGADHTGWPALDPSNDVLVAAALNPTVGVGDGRAFVGERQSRSGDTAVADRPYDQLNWEFLAIAGVLGGYPSALI